jgi:hypothetical protein
MAWCRRSQINKKTKKKYLKTKKQKKQRSFAFRAVQGVKLKITGYLD